ncbi:MAG: AMP-dependent synthetase/ligase [Actinomycetota bacterium]
MKSYELPPLVESASNENITDLLVQRVKKTPNIALFAREETPGNWVPVTAHSFLEQVQDLARGFIAAGIKPGDAVALMSRTRYEWTLIDFALWFSGAVSVPIYETSAPAQIEWVLSNSDAVALIVENGEHIDRYEKIKAGAPAVKQVWRLDDDSLFKLVAKGKDVSLDDVERARTSRALNDLATIIYTSGTTGKPKGCELTHRGFVDLSKNAQLELPQVVKEGHATLLFLPLAHVFARFISVLCVHAGIKVGHQPDTKNVAPAMQSFHPDFLLAVPRVFEKVYNSAEQKAEAGGKGKIFRTAVQAGIDYSRALDTPKGPSLGQKLKHKVFDALVFKKLREAMGGQVKYAVSGGAPLGERLGHFYRAIGLIVLEGYGLTETTAPAMIGRVDDAKIGKVGRVLPGCGVKIADDGEILLKGSNVLRGYWKNPEATAATMEGEWFKTGDIGELDDEGFISITGRKKELIVTAGGKNVAPAALEDPLRASPIIGQAVVIGDQRPFVAALLSLDPEMLPTWLSNNGEKGDMTLAQAAKNPTVLKELQKSVDEVNKTVSNAEAIKKFAVIESELSEESGHLTPSLKIKREIVLRDFQPVIEDIYGGAPTTSEAVKLED